MAKNMIRLSADEISLPVTHPATPTSGAPVRFGERCGVALTDKGAGGNAAANTTVKFSGTFDLSVKGIDGSGNSAVAVGDMLYYTDADTPNLNKKTTGRFFGYAGEAITSGATDTIHVHFNN
jgi:predicted RecA/RadA family phage recombinase